MGTTNTLEMVPLENLKIDEVRLRDPDKKVEEWALFVKSIRDNGMLKPILGRRVGNQIIVIDGGHRLEAAREIGMTQVPVNIVEAEGDEVLELQIAANLHKFETKPVQYAKQIQILIAHSPGRTLNEWADKLHVSRQWLDQRLSLQHLTPEIQQLVDKGQIVVANAVMLAKLPQEEQPFWSDRAMTQTFNDFAPAVQLKANEIKKKNRGQREDGFQMVPKQRKFAAVRDHMTAVHNTLKAQFSEDQRGNINNQSVDYLTGYWNGLRYACTMSDEDVVAARAAYEQQELERAQKEEQRQQEKLAKGSAEEAIRLLLPKNKSATPINAESLAAAAAAESEAAAAASH